MPHLLKQLAYAVSRKQTSLRHMPSGLVEAIPTCADGIEACITRTAEIIRTVRTGLDAGTADEVIEGNAPFLLKAGAASAGARTRAILMVHGLTDSPFVTRDLAGYFSNRGFTVLSILLPGHGTCPGDLLHVSWRDWLRAQADALDVLAEQYDELYLCGFSLGAALNLYQAVTDRRIQGLFLFSPALRLTPVANLTCALNKLSRWAPYLKWIDIQPDEDPYKYESIAANAVCQTRHLVKRVEELLHLSRLAMPVFVAASEDDVTVQSAAVIGFFEGLLAEHKRLLYYSRRTPGLPAKARVIDSKLSGQKIISSSHMAMMVAPDNPHYGQQGDYAFCNHYYRSNPDKYRRCKAFKEDCLGEIFSNNDSTQVLRRLTYNPCYSELVRDLDEFIEKLSN